MFIRPAIPNAGHGKRSRMSLIFDCGRRDRRLSVGSDISVPSNVLSSSRDMSAAPKLTMPIVPACRHRLRKLIERWYSSGCFYIIPTCNHRAISSPMTCNATFSQALSDSRPLSSCDIYPHNAFSMANEQASIAAAINDLSTGVYTSRRKAARAYNIPESTLRDRMNGATTYAISHQNQQRLSPQQENFLADWILEEGACGYPPSIPRAQEMANRIYE